MKMPFRSEEDRARAVAAALRSAAPRRAVGGGIAAPQMAALAAAPVGVLPTGYMPVPQVGPFQIDPATSAATPTAQIALRALAQRGLPIGNPTAVMGGSEGRGGRNGSGSSSSGSSSNAGSATALLNLLGTPGGLDPLGLNTTPTDTPTAPTTGAPGTDTSRPASPKHDEYVGGWNAAGGSISRGHGDGPSGLVAGAVPGRTDRVPITVAAGSFVFPADVVSGVGEGNTEAGAVAIEMGLRAGKLPRGPYRGHDAPKKPGLAQGGAAHDGVDIIVASGEVIATPAQIARLGGGDMDKGHDIAARWVKDIRRHIVKTMRKLPGPVK